MFLQGRLSASCGMHAICGYSFEWNLHNETETASSPMFDKLVLGKYPDTLVHGILHGKAR